MAKKVRIGNKYTNLLTGKEEIIQKVAEDGTVTFESGLSVGDLSAFEYLGNDRPRETPHLQEFEIRDGKLSYHGARIECGSLHVDEVCAVIPGGVILIVTLDSGEKQVKVYEMEEDKFYASSDLEPADKIAMIDGRYLLGAEGSLLLFYSEDTSKHTVDTEEGEKEVEGVFSSDVSVLIVNKDGEIPYTATVPLGDISINDNSRITLSKRGETTVLTLLGKKLMTETDMNGQAFYVHQDSDNPNLAKAVISIAAYTDDEEPEGYCCDMYIHEFQQEKEIGIVTPVVGARYKTDLLIQEKGGIRYSPSSRDERNHPICKAYGNDVVKAVKQYPYLLADGIGGSKLSDRKHCVFTLVNDHYETKHIYVDKTSDRGFVTQIE